MNRQIDAGFIQDQWHYAMAMQGDDSSTFNHRSLLARLDAAQSALEQIKNLGMIPDAQMEEWDNVAPCPETMCSVTDLNRAGWRLQHLAEQYAEKMGIEAWSGDKPGTR